MSADLDELTARLREFRDARDWGQFHTPSNLAAALAVEVAELQELFLWTADLAADLDVVERRRGEIADELADVLISALNFALVAGINPGTAVAEKIERNEERYPVERARGTAKKHNEL